MVTAEQHQRELRDALGLDERDDFEKFVQRAVAAGHKDEPQAVFYETYLAREKIVKMDRYVGESIAGLLPWEFDVEANGFAAGVGRTLVGGFHDAGAAAGDDGEIMLGQALGNAHGRAVIFVARF